jgi:hypothetical protein
MDDKMSKLNDVFDVAPSKSSTILEVVDTPAVVDENYEDADFLAARGNYYEILTQGKAAINTAMMVANESQNPRAIEVLSGLLKNMADINRQLVQMSKDKQEVKVTRNGASPHAGPAQIGQQTNNVFVGTSSDLNKLLAEKLASRG